MSFPSFRAAMPQKRSPRKTGQALTMKCEFFDETPRMRCTIHKEFLYIPSAFQLKQYCTTEWHAICPFFSKLSSNNGSAVPPATERTGER